MHPFPMLLAAGALIAGCGSNPEMQDAPEPPLAPAQVAPKVQAPPEAPVPPAQVPPEPKGELLSERLARTLETVRSNPEVRLIVRLEVPVTSEGELASQPDAEAKIRQQISSIEAAQDAWLAAVKVPAEAAVRTFRSRPYLSLRLEPEALESLLQLAFDKAGGRLSIETASGPLAFDLEPDVELVEHAATAAHAPMHAVIVTTQASVLHAEGHQGSGALIAIIDDGVDLAETLAGAGATSRVVDGGSFTSHQPEPCAGGAAATSCLGLEAGRPLQRLPTWSHGTKVATVAASSAFDTSDPYTGEERHSSGIAPAAGIVTLRVEDGNGKRWMEDVVAALESLVLDPVPGLAAVNVSLGTAPSFPGDCTPTTPLALLVHDYVADLAALDVAVVVSAGNEGYDFLGFPACLDNVITVACVNVYYQGDLVSNWSPSVDVVAPGHGILLPTGPIWGGVATGGTSMAAPQVAGAIALLRAAYPTCSSAQIVEALLQHATSKAPFAKDGISRPHLQIEDAARWLESTCAPPPPQVQTIEAAVPAEGGGVPAAQATDTQGTGG